MKIHKIISNNIIEFIRFDFNHLKLPLTVVGFIVVNLLIMLNKDLKALKLTSMLFRLGWSGSFYLSLGIVKRYMGDRQRLNNVVEKYLESIPVEPHTKRCFDDPSSMLGGEITILKKPSENERGALILNYSYYFPLFLKFYDVKAISQQYNIILEPSWAGYCEINILSYILMDEAVYVMAFEQRDKDFLEALNTNFVTLPVGPNWFVNHDNFSPPDEDQEKDIDIIMVASWAEFKRHYQFFKVLKKLKDNYKEDLKVVLVGYPTGLSKEEIMQRATELEVDDLIEIYEWIDPSEVAELYKRSKVNVLWSRFEGPNRAVIEGMLCNTPVIMREGFNYGEHYDFITEDTGHFANEKTLESTIIRVLENYKKYTPREHALKTRSSITGTAIMDKIISENEIRNGRIWSNDLSVKVNDLHGMNYLIEDEAEYYRNEYVRLKEYILR